MSVRRAVSIEQAQWGLGIRPDWALERKVDWAFPANDEAGVVVLLADSQYHTVTQGSYHRSIRRVLTLSAVQSLGQVELEFDPAAERVILHELAIWRPSAGGAWTKRSLAQRENFLLRQREQHLEQQMLNGRLSLVAPLDDLRAGDAIELEWSIEPLEILPGLRFSLTSCLSWTVPVSLGCITLHHPGRKLPNHRLHSPDGKPAAEVGPEWISWSVKNPTPLLPEPNVPSSHWAFTLLEASDWSDWSEVAGFVDDLWKEAFIQGEPIGEELSRLRAIAQQPNGLAAAAREALRFVQEEVRYLAVDFGPGGGILPSPASKVLSRRFGDCKDKTVLLITLLRGLGIEAWPVLVASGWRESLGRMFPSLYVFNHAIVAFRLGNRELVVDPTAVGQGGDFENLVEPPFGQCLHIRPGSTGLKPLPKRPSAELLLTEVFNLDRRQKNGKVEQQLRATSWMADSLRGNLRRAGVASFSKGRFEALQRNFPELKAVSSEGTVHDDIDANVIEWRTSYELPTWGKSGQKPPAKFTYGAHGLSLGIDLIEGPERRQQPWAANHPLSVRHLVVVKGKAVRKTKDECHKHRGPGFRYVCTVKGRRQEMSFDYHWETTRAEISVEDWPTYLEARTKAMEHTGANVMTERIPLDRNWYWAIVGLGFSLASTQAFFNRPPSPPQPPAQAAHVAPQPSRASRLDAQIDAVAAAYDRGDFAKASELARPLALKDQRAAFLLGMSLLHDKKVDEALEFTREAIKQMPTAMVCHAYAAAAAVSQNLAEAEEAFKTWSKIAPHSPQYLANWGWFLHSTGRSQEALKVLEKGVQQFPQDPYCWLNYSVVLTALNQPDAAEARAKAEALMTPETRAKLLK